MKPRIFSAILACSALIFSACNSLGGAQGLKFEDIPESEWQYVVFGDSTTWGYPDLLAEKIEQELDVTVEIIVRTVPEDHSGRLLKRIRENELFREELSQAELITFVIPWNVFEEPVQVYSTQSLREKCGGEDHQDCLREALEVYKSDAEAIIAELASLVDQESTIVLNHSVWTYEVSWTQLTGDFEVFNEYWKEANSHVSSVCGQYGIKVANAYEAFMGENAEKNPEVDGLTTGRHTTPQGQEIVAELLFELGH